MVAVRSMTLSVPSTALVTYARVSLGAIATKRGSLPTGISASNCDASLPSALRTRITETLAFCRFTTTARLSSPVSAMLDDRD